MLKTEGYWRSLGCFKAVSGFARKVVQGASCLCPLPLAFVFPKQ